MKPNGAKVTFFKQLQNPRNFNGLKIGSSSVKIKIKVAARLKQGMLAQLLVTKNNNLSHIDTCHFWHLFRITFILACFDSNDSS